MRTIESYLLEYGESHRHPKNQRIHAVCVPLIFWSIFGFFHSVEVANCPLSYPMAVLAILFYSMFRSLRVLLIALGLLGTSLMSFNFLPHLRGTSLVIFILSWVGQFYGHRVEGRKPSFFKDLVFLLVGPIWVSEEFFDRRKGRETSN